MLGTNKLNLNIKKNTIVVIVILNENIKQLSCIWAVFSKHSITMLQGYQSTFKCEWH